MSRNWLSCIVVSVMLAAAPAATDAQIESLVDRSPDGYVRFSFAGRDSFCGDGPVYSGDRRDRHWEAVDECNSVHVLLTKSDGRITRLRVYTGGRWRPARSGTTDVGTVSAPAAARYLLDLARTEDLSRAVMPAALADSIQVWPQLIDIARDRDTSQRTKREAMQWLAILAGQTLVEDDGEDPQRETRRQAVFALSQLPDGRGIPGLIELVEGHRYDYVRRLALFWLGQSGDSRALPTIEAFFSN